MGDKQPGVPQFGQGHRVRSMQCPRPVAQSLLQLVGLEEAEREAGVLTWESRTQESKTC